MANFDLNVTPPFSPDAAAPDAAAPDAALEPDDALAPDAALVSAQMEQQPLNSMIAPSAPPSSRPRGRPPGTGKHQRAAAGGSGSAGANFRLEFIDCTTGEDIVARLNDISLQLDRNIVVFQANGFISAVTLLLPTPPRRTVTYKGPLQILTLSGQIGALKISFVGDETHVVQGGIVSGGLIASSPVQVFVSILPRDGNRNESNAAGVEAHSVRGASVSGGLIANSPVQVTAATLPRDGNGNEPNAASTSQPSSSSLPLGLNLSIDGILEELAKRSSLTRDE